ncbi:cAMP phosphodiesterase [Planoprotostelium fungivorum]|uniref:Phosphodiesterase n=1 Tax=Planoprotostelium fungivorum TaxID=1890364 RepID=A0A2P6NUW8_9EUKA|nr:cAMP phosphodiesterase [Planoprotostelium fungivorum]
MRSRGDSGPVLPLEANRIGKRSRETLHHELETSSLTFGLNRPPSNWEHVPELTRILIIGTSTFTSIPSSACKVVQQLGYQVHMAEESMDAIRDIREDRNKYCAVLCTIAQAGKDNGLSILEKIKMLNKRIPVVMLSLKELNAAAILCVKAGAADCFSAPFSVETFYHRLGNIVEAFYLKNTLADYQKEMRILRESTETLKQQEGEAQAAKTFLIAQNTQLKFDLSKVELDSREQNRRVPEDDEAEVYKSNIPILNQEIDRLREELAKRDQKILDMEVDYVNLELQMEKSTITVRQQLETTQLALTQLQEQRRPATSMPNDTSALEFEIEELKNELKGLGKKMEDKIKQNEYLEKQWLEEKNTRMHLESDLIKMDQEINKLRDQAQRDTTEIDALTRRLTLVYVRTNSNRQNNTGDLLNSEETEEEKQMMKSLVKARPVDNGMRITSMSSTLGKIVINKEASMERIQQGLQNVLKTIKGNGGRELLRASSNIETVVNTESLDKMTQQWIRTQFAGNAGDTADKEEFQDFPDDDYIVYPDADVSELLSWEFDVFAQEEENLIPLLVAMFKDLQLLKKFDIRESTLMKWLETIRQHYRPNPYHNFRHAFDVTHTCFMFLKMGNAVSMLTSLDILSLMVAAVCHDLDHPATTNSFQIASKSKLAITYNDISVLENYHASYAFKTFERTRHDIFAGLNPQQFAEMRKSVINGILFTDMAHHFELVAKLNDHLKVDQFSKENLAHRQLLFSVLLHSADISNNSKPVNSRAWSDCVFQEFMNQGDKEREMGLPISPYFDRNNTDEVKVSLNFIDFLVQPLYSALVKFLPSLSVTLQYTMENRAYWASLSSNPEVRAVAATPTNLGTGRRRGKDLGTMVRQMDKAKLGKSISQNAEITRSQSGPAALRTEGTAQRKTRYSEPLHLPKIT